MADTDHVKRGATVYEGRSVEYDVMAEDNIYAVWVCEECDTDLQVRQREGTTHAYTELGCACGAVSISLRVADMLDFGPDAADTRRPTEREIDG